MASRKLKAFIFMSQNSMKNMMAFIIVFLIILPITHSINEEKIAKVICRFSRFPEVDISKEVFGDVFKLSKNLKKQCYMRLRFVTPYVNNIGETDIVLFASHETNLKENLWPLKKVVCY